MSGIVKLQDMSVEAIMAIRNGLRRQLILEREQWNRWKNHEAKKIAYLTPLAWEDMNRKLNALKKEYERLNHMMRTQYFTAWERLRDEGDFRNELAMMN